MQVRVEYLRKTNYARKQNKQWAPIETMALREMGPQLKLPINVPNAGGKGSDIISMRTGCSTIALRHFECI